jgi:hypothetical protein
MAFARGANGWVTFVLRHMLALALVAAIVSALPAAPEPTGRFMATT